MDLETLLFRPGSGWSAPLSSALDSPQTLVLVFGIRDDPAIGDALAALAETYPQAKLAGCSTGGQIFDDQLVLDGLAVAVLRFEHSRVETLVATLDSGGGAFEAGRQAAEQLGEPELRALLLLCDGLAANGSELTRGLNAVLADRVTVIGGLAGDGERFADARVLAGREQQSHALVAVGLYGERLRIRHGAGSGWEAFGVERVVTRSRHNRVFELDQQPALSVYRKYLGQHAGGLPAAGLRFPLALCDQQTPAVARAMVAIDEAAQSVTFAGDLAENSTVRLMSAGFDALVTAAADAAGDASPRAGPAEDGKTDPPPPSRAVLALAVAGMGRRLVLGERAEDELEASLAALPDGTRQVGWYAYGELQPLPAGHCVLNNQTINLTTITEE